MTFEECVEACLDNEEFMREYNRLNGITFQRGGLEAAIDKATGKFEDDAKQLFEFIRDYTWLPTLGA